jgi:hypothetical protein
MKKRTKEEMAKYRRELRARNKAQSVTSPEKAPVTPATPAENRPKCHTQNVTLAPDHVTPAAPVCLSCQAKIAEIAALQERIKTLEAQPRAALPHLPPVDRPVTPKPDGKTLDKSEQEALRQRVIADKVNRINTFGKGHSIGTARL